MKSFTKFFLLMMAIVFSSSLLIAQFSPPISAENPKVKAEIAKQEQDLALQKEPQRVPLQPGAQTQPMPENSQIALMNGKTFTVPEGGSRSLTDIKIQLTVDYWSGEATYNLWSVSAGAYYWPANR